MRICIETMILYAHLISRYSISRRFKFEKLSSYVLLKSQIHIWIGYITGCIFHYALISHYLNLYPINSYINSQLSGRRLLPDRQLSAALRARPRRSVPLQLRGRAANFTSTKPWFHPQARVAAYAVSDCAKNMQCPSMGTSCPLDVLMLRTFLPWALTKRSSSK